MKVDANQSTDQAFIIQAQNALAGVQKVSCMIKGMKFQDMRMQHAFQQGFAAVEFTKNLRRWKGNV